MSNAFGIDKYYASYERLVATITMSDQSFGSYGTFIFLSSGADGSLNLVVGDFRSNSKHCDIDYSKKDFRFSRKPCTYI